MANKNRPLVSIVVPAYNVTDYLDECLKSITSQTYSNLEIILIDDGSADDTGLKCDAWATKDERVHVVHQSNSGLSSARNTGIFLANGKYLLIIDSDDRICRELVQKCVTRLEDSSADLVHFGYCTINEIGTHIKDYPDPDLDNYELLPLILSNRVDSHSWQFLSNRSLYDEISFPEKRKAEDLATTYKIVSRAKRCVVISDCLYQYRIREGSIIADTGSSPEKAIRYYEDELRSFHEMVSWTLSIGCDDYVRAARSSMVHHLFRHYKGMLAAHSEKGIAWVSNQISKELKSIGPNDLNKTEKRKAAMFRNGSLALCYRFDNALRKIAKQLLRKR